MTNHSQQCNELIVNTDRFLLLNLLFQTVFGSSAEPSSGNYYDHSSAQNIDFIQKLRRF